MDRSGNPDSHLYYTILMVAFNSSGAIVLTQFLMHTFVLSIEHRGHQTHALDVPRFFYVFFNLT